MSGENGQTHEGGRAGGRRPISEAEVLAVVEQVADPSETIGASRDARLAERLDAMRLDRDALVSLGEVSAPDGLLDAAIDDAFDGVDREVLAELANGKSTGGIPVSKVIPMRDRLIDTVFDRPVRWLVSAAAALLLLVGVGAFLLAQRLEERAIQADEAIVAIAPSDAESAEEAATDRAELAGWVDAGGAAAGGVPASRVAAGGTPDANGDADVVLAEGTIASPAAGVGEAVSLDEAVALLREGRLAVRVRHREADIAVAAVRALGADDQRSFLVAAEPSLAVADALPAFEPASDRVMASGDAPSPGGVDGVAPAERLGVWIATVDARATALAAMRDVLASAEGVDAVFLALPAAVPHDILLTPASITEESVAWWQRPPTAWRDRKPLPVIVETRAGG